MGDVFVTGGFSRAVDFDPGPDESVFEGGVLWGGFLSHFSPEGDFLGVAAFRDDSDIVTAYSSVVGLDGAIYVVGRFTGTVDLLSGQGTESATSSGRYDAFLLKVRSPPRRIAVLKESACLRARF
jgi:hypothetical protein